MVKVDQKNSWAVDLHLHIPIPSISIQIRGPESSAVPNEPLTFIKSEETVEVHEDSRKEQR